MATITIAGQRVRVIPRDIGREYVGPADSAVYPASAVALTAEALRERGGDAPRAGLTWSCYLDLLYLSTANILTAQAVTTADPAGSLLTVYDMASRAVVATRQLNAVIPGYTPTIYELSLVGATVPGRVTVMWHSSETTLPAPGIYAWELALDIAHEDTVVASGTLEILPAVPA